MTPEVGCESNSSCRMFINVKCQHCAAKVGEVGDL